jgi:toxin FitB
MSYLLDTNSLSEIDKPRPNKGFIDWFQSVSTLELYLSCIVLGEVYKGIELLSDPIKRGKLENRTTKIVDAFDGRIVMIDLDTALIWSRLMAKSLKKGHPSPIIDALIAAQCIQQNLSLVTRNVKDFELFDKLKLICPWTE